MPNNCSTMYIFHTDMLAHLPIQQPQAFAYLHTAKIKTLRSVTLHQVVLGRSTSQEISCIYYSVHVTPILTTVLSRMNPIHHTFPPYFLKIHFNIILSAMTSSSKESLFLYVFWAKLCPILLSLSLKHTQLVNLHNTSNEIK